MNPNIYAYLHHDRKGHAQLRCLVQGSHLGDDSLTVALHRPDELQTEWSYTLWGSSLDILILGPKVSSAGAYSWTVTRAGELTPCATTTLEITRQDLRPTG